MVTAQKLFLPWLAATHVYRVTEEDLQQGNIWHTHTTILVQHMCLHVGLMTEGQPAGLSPAVSIHSGNVWMQQNNIVVLTDLATSVHCLHRSRKITTQYLHACLCGSVGLDVLAELTISESKLTYFVLFRDYRYVTPADFVVYRVDRRRVYLY